MSLTMRELQRLFSASRRAGRQAKINDGDASLLGQFSHQVLKRPAAECSIREGRLFNLCECPKCRSAPRFIDGAQSAIDSLTRRFGPDAELSDVLAALEAEENAQQQQDGSGNGNQQGQNQQPQGQPSSGSSSQRSTQPASNGQSNSGGKVSSAQTTGPAPQFDDTPEKDTPMSPAARPFDPPKPKQPTPAEQRAAEAKAAQDSAKRSLEKAMQELKKARADARKAGNREATRARVEAAKKKVKTWRRLASFDAIATESAPSLRARRHVAAGQGRLQRVPGWLRTQMTDLINRLVMRGGKSGEDPSMTPLMSAPKIVKRMLVRRPLANAFKEDIITGRPVTVFLPDISGSCAKQAQIACDIANAAGFAGVSGSDVLVFPHFNGGIRNEPEYMPWFNGKPVTTNYSEIKTLFEDVCTGQSRFRVRVVICIGDHDGVDRYGNVADIASVTQLIWLHNYNDADGRSKTPPEMAPEHMLPDDWSSDAMRKLTMLVGCGSQRTMLQGLTMTLRRS